MFLISLGRMIYETLCMGKKIAAAIQTFSKVCLVGTDNLLCGMKPSNILFTMLGIFFEESLLYVWFSFRPKSSHTSEQKCFHSLLVKDNHCVTLANWLFICFIVNLSMKGTKNPSSWRFTANDILCCFLSFFASPTADRPPNNSFWVWISKKKCRLRKQYPLRAKLSIPLGGMPNSKLFHSTI